MSDVVEACYDWKGNIFQYRRGPTWIPVDAGNRRYQEIIGSIAAGTCQVVNPRFEKALETHSKDGRITGYLCESGFVPLQTGNAVYAILKKQIDDGTCLVTAPPSVAQMTPEAQIEEFQVAVVFERRWPELDGELTSELPWVFGDGGTSRRFAFSVFNLKGGPDSIEDLLVKELTGAPPHFRMGPPLSAAVIVVKVPMVHLRYVLKHFLNGSEDYLRTLLEDRLEQNFWQTGRKKSDGPSTEWLISHFNLYAHDFISDLANRIVEGYWLEYGGLPVGFLSTRDARNTHRIFAKTRDGKVKLHRSQSVDIRGSQRAKAWGPSVGLAAVSFGTESSMPTLQRALARVSMMVESGLAMEALVLANSVLEVSALETLCAAVHGNGKLLDRLERAGHRVRLDVLSVLAVQHPHLVATKLSDIVAAAKNIYHHRNDYVHDLALPAQKSVLDGGDRGKLGAMLNHFVVPHEQQIWFNTMGVIGRGGHEIISIIADSLPRKRSLLSRVTQAVFKGLRGLKKVFPRVNKQRDRSPAAELDSASADELRL